MERTLLLVDDEENVISSLVRLLRGDGYRILTANSGKAGLALLEQNEVGVIVSDQRMPEMSGVEFLSKVKERYPDTIRIVLSGYTDLNSVTDAINRGAVYKFLTKPWEDEVLRSSVEEAFQRYEMKMENAHFEQVLEDTNETLQQLNFELEQRVEETTGKVMRNLEILQVSQEVLEHLPVAVIGIGDDKVITIANRSAHRLFAADETCSLLGETASDVIPAEMLDFICSSSSSESERQGTYRLADGRQASCWCSPMGIPSSKGVVLVIAPDQG